MDVLSHFFLPFVVALFVLGLHRRPLGVVDMARRQTHIAYAVVFGLSGLAPDLDTAFSWARHAEGLYWLQHRGVSHTLLGAPFFAILPLVALHRLAVWRPTRFGRYRFRPGYIPVAVLGAWTHLVLDSLTYAGVPAFWPFGWDRMRLSVPPFHWIVAWMFPLVGLVLGLHLWRKIPLHQVARIGGVLVVVLIVVAGVRWHHAPALDPAVGFGDPDADGLPGPFAVQVFTRSSMLAYTVVWPAPGGWNAALYDTGQWSGEVRFYPERVEPGTEDAVREARQTNDYKGFRMGVFGPVVTESSLLADGTVRVAFTDVAARFEAENAPRWTPADRDEDWGQVVFQVDGERVIPLVAGW